MCDQIENVKLSYTIHTYSSFSGGYVPENIMVNNPTDQMSRWFTDSSSPLQFIVLKLKSPSVVETIKFGKFIKPHVSDLKKFKVFGGTEEHNLSLILSGGLKKDNTSETFHLRHRTMEGLYIAITYLKIVPLQSYGPNNFTIWYVELRGRNQEEFMKATLNALNLRKEEEAVRIILKHLRQRHYNDAFEALSRETGVRLEGQIPARLWNALVENADFKLTEEIFVKAVADGEIDWFISWQALVPHWREMSSYSDIVQERLWQADIGPLSEPSSPTQEAEVEYNGAWKSDKPGPRGGHQLVVDSTTGTLYLFGGWNGFKDLDDLWSYSTTSERWTLLCLCSGLQGGPGPRSCHKMVFDPVHRKLYTLGRYLDNVQRVPSNMNSDMYMYDIKSNEWSLLCADTASVGGPKLVFDHQMCIDPDTQTIYVFGGRILPFKSEDTVSMQYSGMFAYYISSGTWGALTPTSNPAPAPRVSHSMLFHPVQRRLYIFGGQRNKQHLLELWWWDVGSGACGLVCGGGAHGGTGGGGTGGNGGTAGGAHGGTGGAPPAAGFTQRATLDPDKDLMFVLSGMSKEKDKRVYNALWVFSLRRLSWTCVYRNDDVTPNEPRPRFAHQLVYNPVTKIHYLFGGNPGIVSQPRLRVDDLWSLTLKEPSLGNLVRDARLAIREACYRQMIHQPIRALDYLRTEMRDALDESEPNLVAKFEKLPCALFTGTKEDAGQAEGELYCQLSSRRVRALQLQKQRAVTDPYCIHALNSVLGADETIPDVTPAFEEVSVPGPESWEVGEDLEYSCSSAQWDQRAHRIQIYNTLCKYFRPSTIHPAKNVTDLVAL